MPEFSVGTSLLIEAIKRIPTPKDSFYFKKGIRIQTKDNYVIITTVFQTEYQAKIKADVIKEGEAVIKYNDNLLKALEAIESPKVIVKMEEDNLILDTSETTIKIPVIIPIEDNNIDLFKEIIEANFYLNTTSNELEKAIKQVSFCIDPKTNNEVFKGIYFENKNNNLRLVATDGKQLAIFDGYIEVKEEMNIIVPYEELKNFLKNKNKEMISFYVKKNNKEDEEETKIYLVEELLEAIFITSFFAINGIFPRYEYIIPKEEDYEAKIEVSKEEIVKALKEANKFKAKKKKGYPEPLIAVSLKIKDEELILKRIKLLEEFEISKKIKINNKQGKDIEKAFNGECLLNTFKNVDAQTLKVSFSQEEIPIKIFTDNFLYLLMPLRI